MTRVTFFPYWLRMMLKTRIQNKTDAARKRQLLNTSVQVFHRNPPRWTLLGINLSDVGDVACFTMADIPLGSQV